jgi:hypothetical protein
MMFSYSASNWTSLWKLQFKLQLRKKYALNRAGGNANWLRNHAICPQAFYLKSCPNSFACQVIDKPLAGCLIKACHFRAHCLSQRNRREWGQLVTFVVLLDDIHQLD